MKLKFIGNKQETDDVWSYFFEPDEAEPWIAGQSIRLELPRKTFGVSERRFTIASDYCEGELRITTRRSGSRFKTLLHELEPGTDINAYGIEGVFTWQDEPKNKIFVAGGIGITPFRAILKSGKSVTNITLIYGTSDSPVVFEDDLHRSGINLQIVRDKRLTVKDITDVDGWKDSLIYLSGPEAMVQTLYHQLIEAGAGKQSIKADLFTGNL